MSLTATGLRSRRVYNLYSTERRDRTAIRRHPRPKNMTATLEHENAELRRTVAALQSQLDSCRAERDDTEAQRAGLSEILRAINASSGDPSLVFDAVLERATRLCDAGFGGLTTFDGERF